MLQLYFILQHISLFPTFYIHYEIFPLPDLIRPISEMKLEIPDDCIDSELKLTVKHDQECHGFLVVEKQMLQNECGENQTPIKEKQLSKCHEASVFKPPKKFRRKRTRLARCIYKKKKRPESVDDVIHLISDDSLDTSTSNAGGFLLLLCHQTSMKFGVFAHFRRP